MARAWWCLLLVTTIAGAGIFSYLASTHPSFAWDVSLANRIQALDAPGMRQFMEVLSWSGRYSVATLSYLVIMLVGLRWGGRHQGVLVLSAVLLDFSNNGIKALVGRSRPVPLFLGEAGSFPSGHTIHAVLFLALLWLLLAPQLQSRHLRVALGSLFCLLALLVGFSRIYLERHWPSDVLGAYLIGGLMVGGLVWLWRSRALGLRGR